MYLFLIQLQVFFFSSIEFEYYIRSNCIRSTIIYYSLQIVKYVCRVSWLHMHMVYFNFDRGSTWLHLRSLTMSLISRLLDALSFICSMLYNYYLYAICWYAVTILYIIPDMYSSFVIRAVLTPSHRAYTKLPSVRQYTSAPPAFSGLGSRCDCVT